MRNPLLLLISLFGCFSSAFANCELGRVYGANMGYSFDTSFQLAPNKEDAPQVRCMSQPQFGRVLDSENPQRNMQFEVVHQPERPVARSFDSLPLERGKLSLKIVGDGYTIRFRRKSVSISWAF